jgi:hypothetical protein
MSRDNEKIQAALLGIKENIASRLKRWAMYLILLAAVVAALVGF